MNVGLEEEREPNWKGWLWLVLAIAVSIRLWGTWYGLPFSYWVDEYHEVMRALELGAGGFNLERTTKGGFYFLLFFEYGLYFVFLKIAGAISTAEEFAELFARDPSAFYLMGRVTAAAIGSATVAAVFLVARRAYSTSAGLLAAIILAVNLLHIDLSRRIGVDVPMQLLATLALYFALKIATGGRRSDYWLAASCAALATTTKLPGILVLVPLFIAHTYSVVDAGHGLREWLRSRDLWLAAAVFVFVLVVTNPGVVLTTGYLSLFVDQSSELADGVRTHGEVLEETDDGSVSERSGDGRPNLLVYYMRAIQESMGWPLSVLALMSMAYAAWKRTAADVVLLSYGLINLVVISSTSSHTLYYPRYVLPVIVILTALMGRALDDLRGVFGRHNAFALTVIVAICIATPLSHALTTARQLAEPDSRTLAKQWIEQNVPAGSRVLIEGGKTGPLRETVQLRETEDGLRARIAYWKSEEPKQARLLRLMLAVHEGGGYHFELVRSDSITSFEEYAENGIQYFVVRPTIFLHGRRADASSAELVRRLRSDERVELLKRFEGDSRTQIGPTIEIYRLDREHE